MSALTREDSALDAAMITKLSDIASGLHTECTDLIPALHNYKSCIEQVCGYVQSENHACLLDMMMILLEGIDQLIDRGQGITASECSFLITLPNILSEYLLLPDSSDADEYLLEQLKDPQWIRPITHDEEKELSTQLNEDHHMDVSHVDIQSVLTPCIDEIDLESVLNNANIDDNSELDAETKEANITSTPDAITGDPSSLPPDINANMQELVDIIQAEIIEIVDNQNHFEQEVLSSTTDQAEQALKNLAAQTENIGNAVKLIGLEGLSHCSQCISRNINILCVDTSDISRDHIGLLKSWPASFLDYLKNINDSNAIKNLISLLENETWPEPLFGELKEHTRQLLENPVLLEEEQEQRQIHANLEDVDLTLPDDVNQELLDGLLQDLPSQTEEFSTAIQNIADGGDVDNIDVAQRVAHTLKGAANVVGVNGIANLTHHLEDILQAQSKSGTFPSRHFINVLVRASDCLESMAEALLGIDTAPEDAVNVLQEVLDWANRLDNSSEEYKGYDSNKTFNASPLSSDNSLIEAEPEHIDADPAKQMQRPGSTENVLRIPVSLADEMLRLAGENLIFTSQIQEHINVITRKQDALDLHNQSLLQLSYDLEHLIDIQGFMPGTDIKNTDGVFDPLELDEYHEIHTISRRLLEISADSVELSQELEKDLTGLKELVVSQNQLHKEGEELVLRTRMVPIKTIIPRLKRGVRQASRLTNKQVELVVNDNNTYMDSEVLSNLIEPLMHLLRNAIDHGIEDTDERQNAGKKLTGIIEIHFRRKGNQILIDVIDDGRGLDINEIYSRALHTEMIDSDKELSEENILRLILEPGFTTRDKVTQVSGRGIGLDVVSVKVRDLKGSIDINSTQGEGCRFTLSMPISSFSIHSLLVQTREYIYAISSHGVEEIVYPGTGDIHISDDNTIFELGEDTYNLLRMDSLLDLPSDRRITDRERLPVLLVKDETGSKTAILVQQVIDSRDVVVKNMGCYIPKLNGIIGATVLGDGSVAPVIDLPEMIHEKYRHNRYIASEQTYSTHEIDAPRLPYVLVVDDSLSARRSLAQFVEDLGFKVRTARDGMEAIDIIETSRPDLLLVDMEMPKMNGLELTSHVRATPDINNIPVIMITSRSTDKHRKAAINKGVNEYMIKPFDEDALAQHINTMLKIA